MKECKISKYLSVKKVLGAKNFKRNKMIQNGTVLNVYRPGNLLGFEFGVMWGCLSHRNDRPLIRKVV